ncbi:hypothetical protein [Phytopseudomonas punonensis]|uniref:Uncharacterized protein n=1 Tax=Phytopseudomonas punonensis TaxID=1220495 RepID=A0A1M7LUT4_9GAMM|nr:hypothetical protein [Pseudomonas punonensis]SHM82084.1 hypothetical protein SAMN05216288_4399 [Pseudomonas punonensis]
MPTPSLSIPRLALVLVGLLASAQSYAEMAGGEVGIRLTVHSACQVDSSTEQQSLLLTNHDCRDGYRIRYQNADLRVDRGALAQASTRVDERSPRSRIELYW